MTRRATQARMPVAVENLLRVARLECGARLAFATTLAQCDRGGVVTVPPADAPEAMSADAVAELARRAQADPEFYSGRVFVRAVRMHEPLILAVAPVPGVGAGGVLGVVGDVGTEFLPAQLDVLERLATRLGRHVAALEAVHRARGGPAAGTAAARPAPVVPADELVPRALAPTVDPGPERWWAESDPPTGLLGIGQFFSRTGRLLATEAPTPGALAIVLVEIPDARTAPAAAAALRAQLRFSDPVARIDRDLFAAAVLLVPGTTRADAVEARLGAVTRAALVSPSAVRTTHVLAEHGDRRDVDELLRQALDRVRDRHAGGSGAPWRGAGGSAARLPIP